MLTNGLRLFSNHFIHIHCTDSWIYGIVVFHARWFFIIHFEYNQRHVSVAQNTKLDCIRDFARLYFPFGVCVVLCCRVWFICAHMWKFWWNILCFQLLIERLRWRLHSKTIGKKGLPPQLYLLPNASYIIRNYSGIRCNLWIYNQKSRLWTHCHLIGQMNLNGHYLSAITVAFAFYGNAYTARLTQFTLDFHVKWKMNRINFIRSSDYLTIFCFRICRIKSASWCYAFPFGAH